MLTIEIGYSLENDNAYLSSQIVQYIKKTLSHIVGQYTQITDSVTQPMNYTFTTDVKSKTATEVYRWLSPLSEYTHGITITKEIHV